jgi:hypothetical protein
MNIPCSSFPIKLPKEKSIEVSQRNEAHTIKTFSHLTQRIPYGWQTFFPEAFPSDQRTSLGELTEEEHDLPNPASFPSQIGEPETGPAARRRSMVSVPTHFQCSICVSWGRGRRSARRAASSNGRGREREREREREGGREEMERGGGESIPTAALARWRRSPC